MSNKEKVFPVVVQEWEESEAGWGTRPDGYSVHTSVENAEKFIKDFWNKEKTGYPSGKVPYEYSRPVGTPFLRDTNEDFYNKVKNCGFYGFWIRSLDELLTNKQKEDLERKKLFEKEEAEKEKVRLVELKKKALAKLSDEEREVLGLNKKSQKEPVDILKTANSRWH